VIKSGIYEIRNVTNNKVYIGSAVNIKGRWSRHTHNLRKGDHHSKPLQRSWDKYGEEAFSFTVLEYVEDRTKLLEHEQRYLDTIKSYDRQFGYNILRVAGSSLGFKQSEESRKKSSIGISLATKGVKHSQAHTDAAAKARAKLTDEEYLGLLQDYKDGYTYPMLRLKYNIKGIGPLLKGETMIYQELFQKFVADNPDFCIRVRNRNFSKEDSLQACKMRKEGLTLVEIGLHFGRSSNYMWKVVHGYFKE
jgi:group I intron endonuclease